MYEFFCRNKGGCTFHNNDKNGEKILAVEMENDTRFTWKTLQIRVKKPQENINYNK